MRPGSLVLSPEGHFHPSTRFSFAQVGIAGEATKIVEADPGIVNRLGVSPAAPVATARGWYDRNLRAAWSAGARSGSLSSDAAKTLSYAQK
jgi:hypothetical protein